VNLALGPLEALDKSPGQGPLRKRPPSEKKLWPMGLHSAKSRRRGPAGSLKPSSASWPGAGQASRGGSLKTGTRTSGTCPPSGLDDPQRRIGLPLAPGESGISTGLLSATLLSWRPTTALHAARRRRPWSSRLARPQRLDEPVISM